MNRRIFTLTLAGIGLAAAGCTAQPATTSDNAAVFVGTLKEY